MADDTEVLDAPKRRGRKPGSRNHHTANTARVVGFRPDRKWVLVALVLVVGLAIAVCVAAVRAARAADASSPIDDLTAKRLRGEVDDMRTRTVNTFSALDDTVRLFDERLAHIEATLAGASTHAPE